LQISEYYFQILVKSWRNLSILSTTETEKSEKSKCATIFLIPEQVRPFQTKPKLKPEAEVEPEVRIHVTEDVAATAT